MMYIALNIKKVRSLSSFQSWGEIELKKKLWRNSRNGLFLFYGLFFFKKNFVNYYD